jgi:hypothetical protein
MVRFSIASVHFDDLRLTWLFSETVLRLLRLRSDLSVMGSAIGYILGSVA